MMWHIYSHFWPFHVAWCWSISRRYSLVHRTTARLVTRPFMSLTSLLQIAFPTTSLASNATIAKAPFRKCPLVNFAVCTQMRQFLTPNCSMIWIYRCAITPPWMEFFTARLILSSFPRKQAPSTKTSPHVSLSCIVLPTVVLFLQSQQESHHSKLIFYFQVPRQTMSRYCILTIFFIWLLFLVFSFFPRKVAFLAILWATLIFSVKRLWKKTRIVIPVMEYIVVWQVILAIALKFHAVQ